MSDRVVILGASGHAKVIIDMLADNADVEIVGCTSGDPACAGGAVLDVRVLGNDSVLPELYAAGVRKAVVAVGSNRIRKQLTRRIEALGFEPLTAVSRRAVVSARASLGAGVVVMPGAVINVSASIGDGTIVNTGATVDHDCRVEAFVHIAPGTNLAGCVSLGEGAFLGVGARVVPQIAVGAWSIVGAGAVVIRNIPAYATAVGVPAEVIRINTSEAQ